MNELSSDLESLRYENVSSLLEKFCAMLEDASSSESPTIRSAKSPLRFKEDKDLISQLNERLSSELESSAEPEKMIKNGEESSFDLHEEPNTDFDEKLLKKESESTLFHHHCCDSFKTGPIVQLPVLVAKSEFEVSLFECFPVSGPAECITQMDWSIQSLECRALLPSNTVFIKGELLARITFENNGEMQMQRVAFPIGKPIDLEWLFPPKMPDLNEEREYMFQTDRCNEFHYEFFQDYTEEIFCQPTSIHVVWHKGTELGSNMEIQGNAVLCLDFFQKQYIKM